MRRGNLDLSYKEKSIHYTYDIESMYDLFTIALIHRRGFRLILFGNEKFDDLTKEDLLDQMKHFAEDNKEYLLDGMDIKSLDDLSYDVSLYSTEKPKDLIGLERDLQTMIMCNVFKSEYDYAKELGQIFSAPSQTFGEYRGWNSSAYDLLMLVVCYLLMRKKGAVNIKPNDFRFLSDKLISFRGWPYLLYEYMEKETKSMINRGIFKQFHNMALWRDGHIDWAKIISLGNGEEGERETIMPPALKREMAKLGMDVILDENVTESGPLEWTDEDKENLVYYNFNDTLGTFLIGDRKVVRGSLETKDTLIKAYPYVSAKNTPFEKLAKWSPNTRDETPAKLSSLVLVGPYRIKPQDIPAVCYDFPLPDEDGNLVEQDLLEYMKEKEPFMHPYFYEFFSHFRGKDTTSAYDDYRVKKTQPITHGAMINIPYYKDGKPTNAYVRSSTGGSHGSICAGLSKLSEEEINKWIVSDVGATDEQKPTVDVKNVIHIDWASFYPTMARILKMYLTSEGKDRYSDIIDERISIKELLPRDINDWVTEHFVLNDKQNSYKLVLNSATGAGNQHKEHSLLPIDNKTLSMRLIGNMMIWVLGQRLTQEGAFVLSTNTDGLYVANISLEKAQSVIDDYVRDYRLPVDPEIIDRFINRDTSNRVEYIGNTRQSVGGRLRHGNHLHYTDRSIGDNVPYPLICANATLEYMNQKGWLERPYDKEAMREYIESKATKENLEAFYHVNIGSKKRKLLYDGEKQQRINRLMLTKDGKPLTQSSARMLTNTNMFDLWNHSIKHNTLKGLKFDDVEDDILWYGDLNDNTKLDDLILMKKVKQGRNTHYKEVIIERKIYSFEEWRDLKAEHEFAYLGFKSDARIEYSGDSEYEELHDIEPIGKWNVGVLTGYPNNPKGELINKRKELLNFDPKKLDIDQYLEWAESLLSKWKVTADLEELGMKKSDDTVVKVLVKKRVTKRDVAINFVKNLYAEIENKLTETVGK